MIRMALKVLGLLAFIVGHRGMLQIVEISHHCQTSEVDAGMQFRGRGPAMFCLFVLLALVLLLLMLVLLLLLLLLLLLVCSILQLSSSLQELTWPLLLLLLFFDEGSNHNQEDEEDEYDCEPVRDDQET